MRTPFGLDPRPESVRRLVDAPDLIMPPTIVVPDQQRRDPRRSVLLAGERRASPHQRHDRGGAQRFWSLTCPRAEALSRPPLSTTNGTRVAGARVAARRHSYYKSLQKKKQALCHTTRRRDLSSRRGSVIMGGSRRVWGVGGLVLLRAAIPARAVCRGLLTSRTLAYANRRHRPRPPAPPHAYTLRRRLRSKLG